MRNPQLLRISLVPRATWQTAYKAMWCGALSSRQGYIRGPGRADGQVTQNTSWTATFGRHHLRESNLDHQISIGGMSSDYLGKFSSCFRLHTWSLSLSLGPSPDFWVEKSMFPKSIQMHLETFYESLEMPWSVSKCSRMIPDDFQKTCFSQNCGNRRGSSYEKRKVG